MLDLVDSHEASTQVQSSVPKKDLASYNSTASTAVAEPQDARRFRFQDDRQSNSWGFAVFLQENYIQTALVLQLSCFWIEPSGKGEL